MAGNVGKLLMTWLTFYTTIYFFCHSQNNNPDPQKMNPDPYFNSAIVITKTKT